MILYTDLEKEEDCKGMAAQTFSSEGPVNGLEFDSSDAKSKLYF